MRVAFIISGQHYDMERQITSSQLYYAFLAVPGEGGGECGGELQSPFAVEVASYHVCVTNGQVTTRLMTRWRAPRPFCPACHKPQISHGNRHEKLNATVHTRTRTHGLRSRLKCHQRY